MFKLAPKSVSEALRLLDKDAPLASLYNDSKVAGCHYEDEQAFSQIELLRQKLEADQPNSRCSSLALCARIGKLAVYAQDLFKKFKGVEAVVFMGSALRGKITPKDYDVVVLTEARDPNLKDIIQYPPNKYCKTDIAKLESHLTELNFEIDGIRLEHTVEFAKERTHGFMPLIMKGPFFVFVRSGGKQNFYFANTSGSEYKEKRAP